MIPKSRIGRNEKNLIIVAACAAVLAMGNLFVRYSYVQAYRSLAAQHGQYRLAQAKSLARGLESRVYGVESFLSATAGYQAMREGVLEERTAILKKMVPHISGMGVIDLLWIQPDGRAWAAGHTRLNVSSASLIASRTPVGKPQPWLMSGVEYMTEEKKVGQGVLVIFPIPEAVEESPGEYNVVGYIAALLSVDGYIRHNAGFRMTPSHYVVLVNPTEEFAFHPERVFIGAKVRKAMNLDRFSGLRGIVERMLKGSDGTADFVHYDSREGKRMVRWRMVYTPVTFRGRPWSLGVLDESVDAAFVHGLRIEHFMIGVVFSLMVSVIAALFLVSNRRVGALEQRVKELQDASAVSGILRSVNEELADAKRALERGAKDHDERARRIEQATERLTEACLRVGETLRRPTREQKEWLRDVRFEASHLKNVVKKLREK